MKKRIIILIATLFLLAPVAAFGATLTGIGGTESLGAEIATGTLVKHSIYKITATEADHFCTGCVIGDPFISLGTETCDANNTVQPVNALGMSGVYIGNSTE